MSHLLRRISAFGMFVGNLALSGVGGFAFTDGFRLVAMSADVSEQESGIRVGGRSTRRVAGIAAAIFLLLFVTSEAVAAVVALRR